MNLLKLNPKYSKPTYEMAYRRAQSRVAQRNKIEQNSFDFHYVNAVSADRIST